MEPDIDPLFGGMMNLPTLSSDSDNESEDKNIHQRLREMAANAAAEAVESNCRQQ